MSLRTSIAWVFVALFAFLPGVARADDTTLDVGVSTLGAQFRLTHPIAPKTALRVQYGTFEVDRTAEFDNLVIDVQARLQLNERIRLHTLGVIADRRINGGPLSLSAGLVINETRLNSTSVPTGTGITIDGTFYNAKDAGLIYTTVRWRPLAPYIGAIYAPRTHSGGITPVVEVGAFYQGKAIADFSSTGAIQANTAKFQKYYDDISRQLRDELAPLQIYPVISIGLRARI